MTVDCWVLGVAPAVGILGIPGLVLVAVVGLVQVWRGAGGWVGRWVVAGGFLSIIFYLVNCKVLL